MCRTGDSLFAFSALKIEMDDSVFLPVSAVNALRREALAQLQEKILQEAGSRRHEKAAHYAADERKTVRGEEGLEKGQEKGRGKGQETDRGQELWALVSTPAQMEAAAAAGCDCILVDGDFAPPQKGFSTQKTQKRNNSGVESSKQLQPGQIVSGKVRYICALPPVFRVINRERIRQDILNASKRGYSGILVRTLEELSLALQEGYEGEIIADSSLYSWNGRSLSALAEDCARIVFPLELNQPGILEAVRAAGERNPGADPSAVMARSILPVYGRIPMMESAGCIRKTENLCSRKDEFWYLEDRRGMQLPVRCRCGICANTIYNAVPLSLHQFAGRGLCRKVPVHLCMFTTEDAEETRRILGFFAALQCADKEEDPEVLPAKRLPGSQKKGKTQKKEKAPAENRGKNRGMDSRRSAQPPFNQFTNGHYKTGAL